MPIAIKTFEFVAITIGCGVEKAQRRKLEGKDVLLARKRQRVGIADRPFERSIFANWYLRTIEVKAGQYGLGKRRRLLHAARIKHNGSAETSKKHFSVRAFVANAPAGQIRTGKAIGRRIGFELERLRVKRR